MRQYVCQSRACAMLLQLCQSGALRLQVISHHEGELILKELLSHQAAENCCTALYWLH